MVKNVVLFLFFFSLLNIMSIQAQETEYQYLSGQDRDHTVQWDFFCSEGLNSGKWTTINVPSHWDLQGFGGQNYGHDRNPHKEKGFYRYEFEISPKWRNKRIYNPLAELKRA